MPTELDQDPILSAMRAKMRHLEASMTSYLAFLGIADATTGDGSSTPGGGSTDIPDGAFHDKTIPAAIKMFLSIVRKKQTTAEIIAGLKKGGMESRAKHFNRIVRSTLERMWKTGQAVIKTGGTWALPEFFSPQVRATFASGLGQSKKQTRSKKRMKKGPKKNPVQAKQAKQPTAPVQAPPPSPAAGGNAARIEAFLREHPGKEYALPEIAKAAQIENVRVLRGALGILFRGKKIEKMASGKFRAARSEPQSMPVAS
jgi:hypothetical protein